MKKAGFTLLEVLLSVAIFFVLAGSIFTVVTAATRSSALLSEHRLQAERLDTLLAYFRNSFVNLPASARLMVRGRQHDLRLGVSELILTNTGGTFALFNANQGNSSLVLGVVPSERGGEALAIKTFSERLSESERDEFIADTGGWMPLLDGVEGIQWKFLDPVSKEWVEEWDFGKAKPQLLEMTLLLKGETPLSVQFWIPKCEAVQNNQLKKS
jgi:type II secretory pathway component PulJ